MIKFATHSAAETTSLGARLALALSTIGTDVPLVIALNGDLGAGKTTFVGGFLHALGVAGAIRSPTYTLIETYDLASRTLYHLDLYRLADSKELDMLAPRDLLNPGSVLLVEWAERGGRELPKADLAVNLSYPVGISRVDAAAETDRHVEFVPASHTGKQLATSLQNSADEERVSP